jgi:hypothetical protein
VVGFRAGFRAGLRAGFRAGLLAGFAVGLLAGLTVGFGRGVRVGIGVVVGAGVDVGSAADVATAVSVGVGVPVGVGVSAEAVAEEIRTRTKTRAIETVARMRRKMCPPERIWKSSASYQTQKMSARCTGDEYPVKSPALPYAVWYNARRATRDRRHTW